MARYIDAENLKRNIRVNLMPNVDVDGTVTVENAERYFLNLIDKTSEADVVEVVRCKDCEYCIDLIMGGLWCEHPDNIMPLGSNPTDFCSYGKRRDE